MYKFRRLDNDQIIEVDYEKLLEMDCTRCVTVQVDGKPVTARRLNEEEERAVQVDTSDSQRLSKPVINSVSLGFNKSQLEEMENHRKQNGFQNIEFIKSPLAKDWYAVKASSSEEMARYSEACGFPERSNDQGVSAKHIDKMREHVLKKYPVKKKVAV